MLAVVLILGGLAAKQLYEFSRMSPLQTGEVIPGIYAINNDMVNIYFIKGDGGYIMIDAGVDKNKTSSALEQLGISTDEVRAVLLTHSDGDHVMTLPLFPNAQVYLSEQEVQMIDGKTSRNLIGKNSLSVEYKTLAGGETAEIAGLQVKCILTPGHTPGSMCYLIDDKHLFTGDTLSLKDGKVDLFVSFFNMDDKVQSDSLYLLAKFIETAMPEYIFTGHHGYTNDPNIAFKNWK